MHWVALPPNPHEAPPSTRKLLKKLDQNFYTNNLTALFHSLSHRSDIIKRIHNRAEYHQQ